MRVAYAASMNEETVKWRPHVMHILVMEPFTLGKISRDVGDTYCKPRGTFFELWDEGDGRPTCSHCMRISERLEKAKQKEQV